MNKEGTPVKFDQAHQNDLMETVIGPMACDGLRTICVAYKDFSSSNTTFLTIIIIMKFMCNCCGLCLIFFLSLR